MFMGKFQGMFTLILPQNQLLYNTFFNICIYVLYIIYMSYIYIYLC